MKGSHTLIVPYVGHVLGSLMKLLNDPSSAVVGAALSTIGSHTQHYTSLRNISILL